jgi:predicted O-methyltransferase YrrM
MIKTINDNFILKKSFLTNLVFEEYNYYIENISSRPMAASLPCCIYLLALYDRLLPLKVLELGSGFTSYCLRFYKKLRNINSEIYSIDTSKEWLETSKNYCKERELDINNFQIWDYFKECREKFDLIFVDIDSGPRRHLYFESVFKQFSKVGTFIYLDDLHKPQVYKNLDSILSTINHKRYNIKDLTIDRKRFSTLVEII